jgi:hypothetical protein
VKTVALSLVTAAVGGVLLALEAIFEPARVGCAWHAAATFGLTLTLGGFLVGAVLVNAGAKWPATLRHVHGALAGALPVACLAYIPLLHVSEHVALDVVYLVVAIAFEEFFRAASLREKNRAGVGAVGLVVVSILISVFFFDVTLAPSRPWGSDMFPLYALVGAFGAGVGATVVVGAAGATTFRVTPAQASAWGRIELVATSLWAYCAFALYMLIWVADLPREVGFFVPRTAYAWAWTSLVLVALRFVVPFLVLVPRAPKQRWRVVGALGALMVVSHAIDCELWIVPSSASAPNVLDLGAFLVVGGACALTAALRFRRHAPLPAPPDVDRALAYESS